MRKKGFANLTAEEAAHIPSKIDLDDADHKQLFRAYFEDGDALHGGGMSAEQWDAMFRAQCTWDATMGMNAVQALRANGGKDAILVVLLGSGHVAYGLGAERQARLWFDGKTASLIPVPVLNDDGQPRSVRASYANFLWGVAPEKDPLYPSLGLSTPEQKPGDHLPVIAVQKGSLAEEAGFKVGDGLVSMDGVPLKDKETLNRLMSQKRWGDEAEFRVLRGTEPLTLDVKFRRKVKTPES